MSIVVMLAFMKLEMRSAICQGVFNEGSQKMGKEPIFFGITLVQSQTILEGLTCQF